jgi:hypothetical protein
MLAKMKAILKSLGYQLFSRPYELNIVGVRSKNTKSNRFDDELHVFYKIKTFRWEYHVFKITTDPGTYWLENPLQPKGTAILAQGQYLNAYHLGMHQGKYKALVQQKPVSVIRDYDRNAWLDFLNGSKEKGLFGINIHRALIQGKTKYIDRFSAGCQVFENTADFEHFLTMCDKHAQLHGNNFTYTLIDFRAIRRESIKRIAIGTLTLGAGLIGYIKYDHE